MSTGGVIYAIGAEGSSYVKIGCTHKKVETRLRALQTGYPGRLSIVATVPVDQYLLRIERKIHTLLEPHCAYSEWFALAMDQATLEAFVLQAMAGLDDMSISEVPSTLGHQVKQARLDKGWSQKVLCEQSGLSQKYLSEIENDNVDPRFSIVKRIAEALGVSLNQLGKDEK